MPPRRLPSPEVLRQHAKDDWTNAQIARYYGVSDEAVRQAFARLGLKRGPERATHARHLPWKVRADHNTDFIARRLRMLSKREQGWPLTASEQRQLDEWLEFMDGGNALGVPLAVHYDRFDPEGFWLEPAVDGDRDYIHPPMVELNH